MISEIVLFARTPHAISYIYIYRIGFVWRSTMGAQPLDDSVWHVLGPGSLLAVHHVFRHLVPGRLRVAVPHV